MAKNRILLLLLISIGAPTTAAVIYSSVDDEHQIPEEISQDYEGELEILEAEETRQASANEDYDIWAEESLPAGYGSDDPYQSAKDDAWDAAKDARDARRDITGSDSASNAVRRAAVRAERAAIQAGRSLDRGSSDRVTQDYQNGVTIYR